ncbi:MAG: hypothetical protein AB1666_07885 [Pseudomonadota bacterium]
MAGRAGRGIIGRRRAAAPAWGWWLALALVAAQWLGVLHRAAHVPAAGAEHAAASAPVGEVSRWASWFGDHADERACLVFDHATCADAAHVAVALVVESPAPSVPRARPCPCRRGAPARAFDARAPPAFLS